MQSLKILAILKICHSISMHKTMKDFHKKFTSLGNVVSRTNYNKTLKNKVLINAGDLYNDLYYIYKDKYNKKIV